MKNFINDDEEQITLRNKIQRKEIVGNELRYRWIHLNFGSS